ncbi:hypothetical protein GCM10011344_05810 [Dokdonia pacifica]|uniref:GDSL-like Lipase/Acylhydrolase family protein n=1 Tax=Dokdonia pacifica TaxID=1627892 RepID=A0A238ZR30_9FLAO|nr:GDSL-type esterase/lipase family protein [Dokdonia pacifica]GGG08090.1 hypothetical protein GCM10011344_05810 [Dokdonia pacifica]SNR85800.1 GDSL-like Lipase/Acylhydrolase family protein [Dokdonia pacifica]
MQQIVLTSLFLIISTANLIAQDPHRFDEDMAKFAEMPIPKEKGLTIFTGSSSIRFWENLSDDCNEVVAINTAFGGSHMSDLLYFIDQTVIRFQPETVYIYEGDNDIASEKKPENILKTAKQITAKILASNSKTKIYFISAKPSPSRWQYKEQYLAFNSLLKAYCDSNQQLSYIDVWNPMLAPNGRPISKIFIEDSLHMNRQGYLLWKDIICSTTK